jgi:hypothetical protein
MPALSVCGFVVSLFSYGVNDNFLDVAGGSGISGVINFRLEQVIIPKSGFCFGSSLSHVYIDYCFYVYGY